MHAYFESDNRLLPLFVHNCLDRLSVVHKGVYVVKDDLSSDTKSQGWGEVLPL